MGALGGMADGGKLTGPLPPATAPPLFPLEIAPPVTVLDSPESDGDAVMFGTFSFDARSMAEFRRIIMVLVWGSISSRCSLILCWFRLSRVKVDEDEDEDSSFENTFT